MMIYDEACSAVEEAWKSTMKSAQSEFSVSDRKTMSFSVRSELKLNRPFVKRSTIKKRSLRYIFFDDRKK